MVKSRTIETESGITGELTTNEYDKMMRRLRNFGWLETDVIIKKGITSGLALEIGPGPGYLGLEWLKKTSGTRLNGLDISEDMLALARKNAADYGFTEKTVYFAGDARKMPFEDASFDAVFTSSSMHEWANPEEIFNEMERVLKTGGRYVICDLRRDMKAPIKWLLWLFVSGNKEMRDGVITSINAAYTVPEIEKLLNKTKLKGWRVSGNPIGITIAGQKT